MIISKYKWHISVHITVISIYGPLGYESYKMKRLCDIRKYIIETSPLIEEMFPIYNNYP